MNDALKGSMLFKIDTGEFVFPMENSMLFITMTVKDLQMAKKYMDLLVKYKATNSLDSITTDIEYKHVKKYFYDKGRYIKKKYPESMVQIL